MDENLKKAEISASPEDFIKQAVRGLSSIVDPISKYGAYIAAFMLTCMMFLTFIDVVFGQLGKWAVINSQTDFFRPIVGGQELVQLLMLLVVSFALGYTAFKNGHIRVDVLMQYTSRKTNLWFDIFANFFSMIFYIFITWQALVYGIDNIRDKSVTTILNIPLPPFNFIVFLGGTILTLIFLRDFLKCVEEVKN